MKNPILERIEQCADHQKRLKRYLEMCLENLETMADKEPDLREVAFCNARKQEFLVIKNLIEDWSFATIRPIALAEATAKLLPIVCEQDFVSRAELSSAMASHFGTADPAEKKRSDGGKESDAHTGEPLSGQLEQENSDAIPRVVATAINESLNKRS